MKSKIGNSSGIEPVPLDSVFNNMSDGFEVMQIEFDEAGQPVDSVIIDVNPAFEKQTGWKRDEIIGRKLSELLPQTYHDILFTCASVVTSGESTRFEEYYPPFGRWYEVSAYSLRKENRLAVIFTDISRHKVQESKFNLERFVFLKKIDTLEEARRELDFQAQLLSNVQEAISAYDEDMRIVYWNDIAEKMYGWSREDTLGQVAKNLSHTEFPYSSRDAVTTMMREDGSYSGEVICYHKDGRPLQTDVHAKVLKGPGGAFKGAVASFRDISERKGLEAQNLRHASALQAINDVYEKSIVSDSVKQLGASCLEIVERATGSEISFVGEIGEDGVFHDIASSSGDRNLCGLQDTAGHRKQPADFRIIGLYGSVLQSGKTLLTNDPSAHPDSIGAPAGHPKLKSFLGVPFTVNGKVYGMIAVANKEGGYTHEDRVLLEALAPTVLEVLLHKRAEEALYDSENRALELAMELEKKNKLITDFFINISHEFKTPLTILMLGLELLENKVRNLPGGGADISKNIIVMKQNAYRLNRLIANLLDITKLDAGFMEPKWERADIVALVKNLTESAEFYARQKDLKFTFSCNAKEKPINTDGAMLERILLNLLSNAIKHTPPGGQIAVRCQFDGDVITISVKDNGEGIPDDKKGIIFDRFSQVDTKLTRASEGSGIGLALTKSIVELLGGKITFESTLGEGSEFIVKLPVLTMKLQNKTAEHGDTLLDKKVRMELSDIILG